MASHILRYVTNRGHEGDDRFHPIRYGRAFSGDGGENLRFGQLTLEADDGEIGAALAARTPLGIGDGGRLSQCMSEAAARARIDAYPERLDPARAEARQRDAVLGSQRMFEELRATMLGDRDVLVFVHGYAVSWEAAVGSAAALQVMLNRPGVRRAGKEVLVLLFTWPSDGSNLPFVAYRSDRSEAGPSGAALGRGLLRLRDYLVRLDPADRCGQNLNVLCHSMGNYVLQHAVARISDHVGGGRLPRLFDQVFQCAADVDEDVHEPGRPLARLPELCSNVNVYFNRGDVALHISDVTKGHPDRLGTNGAARPGELHHKVRQIDCSDVVTGVVEHSYYLTGRINEDIRLTLDGMPPDAPGRDRRPGRHANTWQMV